MNDIFLEQKKKALLLRQGGFEERVEALRLLKLALLENEEELCAALFADFGKSVTETQITEIYPTVKEIDEAIRSVRGWMRDKVVGTPLILGFGSSWIQYQPRGVSLVVSSWNYPIYLSLAPMVAALAAGCTVFLKPSELVPHTSRVLKEILARSFSRELVTVVEGGVDEARSLLKLPFDHIFFTGSTAVGKIYMEAAAKNLTSITLELGGKSPAIVDLSADLKTAAQKIIWGKFVNAGQTCVAPDYILVHEKVWPEFKEKLKAEVKNLYPQAGRSADLCQIVSEKHQQRLLDLLNEASKNGAEVLTGGAFDLKTRKIDPTCLFLGSVEKASTDSLQIMREEIFGPLLPVLIYKDSDEAIRAINQKEKPLALYIFAQSSEATTKFLSQTSSGGVCINEVLLHLGNHELPFGGVNHSGLGHYHGHFGFLAFSHARAVYKQSVVGKLLTLMYPPYNKISKGIIRKMIDWSL